MLYYLYAEKALISPRRNLRTYLLLYFSKFYTFSILYVRGMKNILGVTVVFLMRTRNVIPMWSKLFEHHVFFARCEFFDHMRYGLRGCPLRKTRKR